ncbi:HAD family hydrolase [Nonomuraea rubra]|uniref:Putative hydrolase of the HAD superfamily n=1 Tax=Nonomuraea rubra TaxID=46180 RepID=A0A7X0NZ01_9ACTN|nr:HAD-IA family hydrolase [Nonomuraea rubra]MBB6552172.1 putative hydrolase of the HAD superfamily [Nonomuraea rubra]
MDLVRAVVFDAMGVLYRDGNVQGRVLIPYLRERGCQAPEQDIRAAYRAVTLGRTSTGAFWAALGAAAAGDEDYCLRHRLTDGVPRALAELAGDGLELACLSNDAAAWSALVRRRFGLERHVGRWLISSELGARKPDPAPYRAVPAALGVPAAQVVFVDDRPANLAPARALGMRTILFRSDDTAAHPDSGAQPGETVATMPELVAAVRRAARGRAGENRSNGPWAAD